MIAFVFFVIFSASRSGSMLNVRGSISTKTGIAPSRAIDPAVAKNVNDGQITSSPGLDADAPSAQQSSASVPLQTPIACFVPQYVGQVPLEPLDVRAEDQRLLSQTSSIARRISLRRGRYCACRSSSFTFMARKR